LPWEESPEESADQVPVLNAVKFGSVGARQSAESGDSHLESCKCDIGYAQQSFAHCTRLTSFVILVGVTGFEPATSCSQSKRATGLRYTPTKLGLCHFGTLRHQIACLLQIPPRREIC
jgi:hypothetical protein